MRHLEDDLQEACVRWFDYQFTNIKQLLIHIPNGGKRNAREAAKFKRMGVRAGVADLLLLVPSKPFHGLFIEMKAGKGTQQDSQKEFEKKVVENGYQYVVCRSLEHFINVVSDHLKGYSKNNL